MSQCYIQANVLKIKRLFLWNCMSITIADRIGTDHNTKVRKRKKIRNRYNQTQYLTQDTTEKVTSSQLDITNKSQEVSPFPAGDNRAPINRRAQKHNKNKTEMR